MYLSCFFIAVKNDNTISKENKIKIIVSKIYKFLVSFSINAIL